MLFSDQRKHSISIPSQDANGQPANIRVLVDWLCENLMKDKRKELFVLDDSVYVSTSHPYFLCAHTALE